LVVKFSWPSEQKRGLEPRIYEVSQSDFGTPIHLISFEVVSPNGSAWSNAHFLPTTSQISTARTGKLFDKKKNAIEENPERRSMWATTFVGIGESLEECVSAWDLCECLLHASFGWLSFYVKGYLHRDVSVGNILKIKNGPRQRTQFSTRSVQSLLGIDLDRKQADAPVSNPSDASKVLRDGVSQLEIGRDRFWEDLSTALKKTISSDDKTSEAKYVHQNCVVEKAKELEELAQEFKITTVCKAFLSDCDMAAELKGYFEGNKHEGSLSGTAEFMNQSLRRAVEEQLSYLQSPVDDMYSFLWTALWCTLFNTHECGESIQEKQWRKELQGSLSDRVSVLTEVVKGGTEKIKTISSIVRDMIPLLRDWKKSLDDLSIEWKEEWPKVEEGEADEKLLVFHRFAFCGILNFTELVKRYEPQLRSTE
ncbi:hypothetical protein K435DRAFT_687003, partial [Dendrothele bispora CBS 962.96]